MADTLRKTAAQRARESNHLNYGHFGTCTYDETRKEWSFLRKHVPPSQNEPAKKDLIHHGGPEFDFDLLQGSVRVLSRAIPTLKTFEPGGTLNAKTFLKFLPQSATGLAEYESILRFENRHVKAIENEGNPPCGNSLAFGQASVPRGAKAKRVASNVPILAHVLRRDELKLRIVCLDRMSLRDSKSTFGRKIEAPCISTTYVGTWTSTHGLIRQVISSEDTTGRAQTAIAVRTLSATTLLTSLLHGTAFAQSSSILYPNVVVTIPCQFTGGASHADIAFQPQETDQIAIVDTTGNWSIWRVEESRSYAARANNQARLVASRSFYTDYQSSKTSKVLTYPDGWHKICWLATTSDSSDRVLVCNRYLACMYDTNGKLKGEVNIRMNVQGIRDSILDVISVTSSAQECFVLTTSSLLWMSTNTAGSNRMLADESGLTLLGSWNHFRAHSDTGLCMHLLDHSNGTFVLLSTNASPLLTIYHASRTAGQYTIKHSFSDPIPIESPRTSSEHAKTRKIEAIKWIETTNSDQESKGSLFKILFSDSSGNISEAIYQVKPYGSTLSRLEPLQVIALPPRDQGLYRSDRYVDSEESEDFAVGDDSPDRSVDMRFPQNEDAEPSPEDDDASHDATQPHTTGEMINFQHFLQQIEEVSNSVKSLRLLSDLFPERPYIDEIEDNSDQLTMLLKKYTIEDIEASSEDTTPLPKSAPDLITFDSRSLLEIYESLLQTRLSPLPSTTPIRDRMHQERQCRQQALETFLSNHAVHPKIWTDPNPSRQTLNLTLNTQEEASDSDLSDRARRKKERRAKAKEARLEKQNLRKKAVLEAASSLPIIMSSQIPIREVKSSQIGPGMSSQGGGGESSIGGGGGVYNMPGITLTQPERGVHGSRTTTKGKKKGKSVRVPGFN